MPAPEYLPIALGRAIRQLRKEASITQLQLAERSGIPLRSLRRVERGEAGADWGLLRHLTNGLEITLIDVLRLAEAMRTD